MSSLTRKLGKRQGQAVAGLLGNLASPLQEMEGQLRQVAGLSTSLQELQTEWAGTLQAVQQQIAELAAQQQQQRRLMLTLLHGVLNGQSFQGLTLEQFLSKAEELDERLVSLKRSVGP